AVAGPLALAGRSGYGSPPSSQPYGTGGGDKDAGEAISPLATLSSQPPTGLRRRSGAKSTSGGGALGRGSWSGTARRYPVWTCFLRVVGKVLEGPSGLLCLSGEEN